MLSTIAQTFAQNLFKNLWKPARGESLAVKFALRASEICFACEMRAVARVKWRFRGSAVSVSIRDGFKTFYLKNRPIFPENPISLVIARRVLFCARRGNL